MNDREPLRAAPSDDQVRAAALALPDQWIVEDVCDTLDVSRHDQGTRIFHIVRDLVADGQVIRRDDGFYEVASCATKPRFPPAPPSGSSRDRRHPRPRVREPIAAEAPWINPPHD